MGYLNKVLLIGRLGQDPEKRTTSSGKSVVNVSLATTEYFKDNMGQKKEKTEWHKVVLWGAVGDVVSNYCKKGSQVYVEGSLQTREWKDKDGNKRYSTEINGRSVQLLDSKQSGQQPSGNSGQFSQHQVPADIAQTFPGAQVDDDCPF